MNGFYRSIFGEGEERGHFTLLHRDRAKSTAGANWCDAQSTELLPNIKPIRNLPGLDSLIESLLKVDTYKLIMDL